MAVPAAGVVVPGRGCRSLWVGLALRAALSAWWSLFVGWAVAIGGLFAWWLVAVDDLPVGAVGGGGGVGVQDEAPAAAVNADIMVELAQKGAVPQGGFAAVALVAQVVDVAVGGGLAAAGPGAVPVAEHDGAADVDRDVAGEADVERDGAGVERLGQQSLAQGGGQAGRAGDQVDGQAGDRVPQRPPCLGGQGLGPGSGAGVRGAAVRGAVRRGVSVGRVRGGAVRAVMRKVPGFVEVGRDDGDHLVHDGQVGVAGDDRDDQGVARGGLGVFPR